MNTFRQNVKADDSRGAQEIAKPISYLTQNNEKIETEKRRLTITIRIWFDRSPDGRGGGRTTKAEIRVFLKLKIGRGPKINRFV